MQVLITDRAADAHQDTQQDHLVLKAKTPALCKHPKQEAHHHSRQHESRGPSVVRSARLGGNQNHLAQVMRQESLIGAPQSSINAAAMVRHHEHLRGRNQCQCEGREVRMLKHWADVEILRHCQETTPGMVQVIGPGIANHGDELEDALSPGVADKQMAVQTARILHQRPAHVSRALRYRLDVLVVDRVDARPIFRVVNHVVGRRLNQTRLHGPPDFRSQELHICPGHTPAVRRDLRMQ
mmetsp:Transcript_56644/g.132364  ORF Transcript_56644/g.132364 Transcript_56644/m.132364 type:complete len:239 (+) Transcript_56644:966-1682(+)